MAKTKTKQPARAKPEDRLGKASRLVDLRLRESLAQLGELRDKSLPGHIRANALIETSLSEQQKKYRITVRFDLLMSYEDAQDQPVIRVVATYQMTFSVSELKLATKTALSAFGQGSALFIIWPYWRQHVTATIAQMGLPPYILPLYREGFFQAMQEVAVPESTQPG